MDQTLKMKLDEVEQSLVETFELALTYGDDASKDIENYQNMFGEMFKIKNTALRCGHALDKAKEQPTVEDFERQYSAEIKNGKAPEFKKTKEYKEFQARLRQVADSFDMQGNVDPGTSHTNRVECDEFVIETQIQVIDPLTKRRMENPVKNTICGHHYEKSSILEAIKINRRLRCPVAGCGNNTFIQSNHLVNDDALKVQIMNMQNEEFGDEDPLGI